LVKKYYYLINFYCVLILKRIEDDLKSELKGKFEKATLALLEPVNEYESRVIKEAMSVISFL
jgi:hypothetical protein